MTELRIAKGFSLELDAVTKTFAILAQRRKGKTYTASVVAEEMVAAGQPWVALDPTGAWWGLRASANGKKEGLPVLVIGGAHGQLPLERTAGKLMADLVVDDPGWYVFDFSLFESKAAERQFATDFAERFYRRKGQSSGAVHLFVDEADVFVPQRSPQGDQRMLGAFESIVRRGGIRGIGTTLISQRAAVVNKNVLEQIDVLVTLRTVGPNDQKAIKAYVDAFGTPEQQTELMGSLAALDLGEAWVWEPGGDVFERVRIRERHTYNSSATPKAGESQGEPLKLADVDLEALRDKIAATVEKAKAEDPAELRKQIAALKKELAERPEAAAPEPPEPIEVKVPILDGKTPRELSELAGRMEEAAEAINAATEKVTDEIDRAQQLLDVPKAPPKPAPAARHPSRPAPTPALPPPLPPQNGEVKLKAGARRMLGALAQLHPEPLSRNQVATLADVSPKSGTFSDYLSALRKSGLMEDSGDGRLMLTAAGIDHAGDAVGAGAPSPDVLAAMWGAKLKAGARRMLSELMAAHPDGITREELGERAEISVSSGTFSDYLSALNRNGLLEKRSGQLYAGEALFLGQGR